MKFVPVVLLLSGIACLAIAYTLGVHFNSDAGEGAWIFGLVFMLAGGVAAVCASAMSKSYGKFVFRWAAPVGGIGLILGYSLMDVGYRAGNDSEFLLGVVLLLISVCLLPVGLICGLIYNFKSDTENIGNRKIQ